MDSLDLSKRDMHVVYGERTFAPRAYRDAGAWRGVIIENRTPLLSGLGPAPDPAVWFGTAVAFIAAVVDSSARVVESVG